MEDYKKETLEAIALYASDNRDTARELLEMSEDDRAEHFRDAYNTDSITGNATGSFYCSAYAAQKQIDKSGILWEDDFIDWLGDMCLDLGEQLKRGAECVDVLARCWVLESVLSDSDICEALRSGIE